MAFHHSSHFSYISQECTQARCNCLLWIPKVTLGSFSAFVLHGLGSNPAAVRMFRKRSAQATCHPPFQPFQLHFWRMYPGQVQLSSMDSKGNVRQFFGVRFAWPGLESCCCSNVSEAFRPGHVPSTIPAISATFLKNVPRQGAIVFYGFQR